MIQVVNLSKGFGTQVLFQDVTFTLGKGERVGLVGRNGTGKSTLFKILLGEESYDSGEYIIPKNYQIGTLKQHLHFTHSTILDECKTALRGENAEFEQYKVEKMLLGLGFKMSDFTRAPSDFSGGYQIRLNLAKVLLSEPDCLLLDEPTNYLDIVSMRWLTKFLREFKGEMILITHDRGFMDDVTTHTMGIWRQKLFKIKGDSTKYFEQIVAEEEMYEKTRVNAEKKRKDLEEFVARFKAKASKATQAQSRMKLLEKMPTMDALAMQATLDFEFNFQECPGKVLIDAKELSFGYTDQNLISNLNLLIQRNDKIAIIGKNGKGKSTLLNLLARELEPKTGSINSNVNLLMGHFGQTNINRLNLENTIEEEILAVNPMMGLQRARSIAGVMMFSGDLAKKKIKVLSGGERARVLLGKLLVKPTNLLLLDEPTNHLDQESVEALTLELQNYPGAVIIVTHSESMLRDVATKLVVFHHDKVEFLSETYDDFLKKIGWEEEEAAPVPQKTADKPNRQEVKRLRSEMIIERGRELNPMKKKMESLEKEIMKLEDEQKQLEGILIDPSNDSKKMQESSQRLGQVNKKIDSSFEELTEITMKHDEIFQSYELKLKDLEV
ncbi:ABC-F family ATP-binding cassette domain-containing protein [Peredibacter starrii]|uniref:ABC-F family ATP-binding cassette domain-containing protein n=1 Tax=Peredibacter starrii TaxID=28202 RepID=A0AAX4HN88_9BACT|nr:ABC-F family ATP-binding cassette domain-containing protein [Peredibacter starrii]WPU64765.1 ABC-F family ATP-binding cassette domain-containing protein [Peredibacter starrii]